MNASTIVDTLAFPLTGKEPAKTILIGGILLSTGTMLLLIPVVGYVVCVLSRTTYGDGTAPAFEQWLSLAVDGGRALVVWLVYASIPLVVLIFWIEMYAVATEYFSSPFSLTILTATVQSFGVGVGGPIAARLFVRVVQDVIVIAGLLPVIEPPYPPTGIDAVEAVGYAGGLYALTLSVSLYVAPAALVNVARKRTLGAGFDFERIGTLITRRRYALAWVAAVVLWAIGALFPMAWNEWRWRTGGLDWDLVSVGVVPVLAHPTTVGMTSATLLLVASFANFYLLVVGYALVGRAAATAVPVEQSQQH